MSAMHVDLREPYEIMNTARRDGQKRVPVAADVTTIRGRAKAVLAHWRRGTRLRRLAAALLKATVRAEDT